MSYWDHARPVQRARSVDLSEVAAAAVALLDDGGLRALTLRSAAQRVGVAPASLYSRVESVDDLFDIALDHALAADGRLQRSITGSALEDLVVEFFRHLRKHRWAGQVIGMRAPRGPAYLRLAERLCVLMVERGVEDPLGTSYRLSNLAIGSALTAPMASNEKAVAVESEKAPTYARLHAEHQISPEEIFRAGVRAMLGDG